MTKDFKKQSAAGSAFGQYGLGWMVGGVAIGLLIGAGMFALANKGNTPAPNASTTESATLNTSNAGDAANAPAALPGTGTTQAGNGAASLQDAPAATTNESAEETPGFSYHAVLPQLEVDVPLAVQVEQQTAATRQEAAKKKEAAVPSPKEADKKPALADTEKAAEKAKPTEKNTDKAAEKAADKKAAPPAASAVPNGFNGFQIGSYKTQDQATDMQNRLKNNGLNSRVEQANVQGTTWFRVKMGPASSPEMLQKWQQTLSKMGISPMAVRM